MRGPSSGALDRVYLHSPVTTALWYGVAEAERLLSANLLRGVMVACTYGNPEANIRESGENLKKVFRSALKTMPYVRFADEMGRDGTDQLIEEWKRLNAGLVQPEGEESAHV